jgi:hypothetical protein
MKIFSLVIALVVSLLVAVHGYRTYYVYDSQIDAVIDRAQVAADREDMLEYMMQLKQNMQKLGITSGHFAILWKTDANNLALHYQTVSRIIERLEAIKDIPKTDTAYQVALDDIRGTIRELENPGGDLAWRDLWWIVIFFGMGIWLFPMFVLRRWW